MQKRKGYRIEHELVLRIGDDLSIEAEVKARANGEGFATLERWLGENDLLFPRRDRAPPLVVMNWEMYIRLMVFSRSHV